MRIFKTIFFMALIVLTLASACITMPTMQITVSTASKSSPDTSIALTQASSDNVYHNSKYSYSLSYPNSYNITVVSDEYVEIGEKIVVEVRNIAPTAPLGDGAFIENTSDVQIAGHPAKLLTGYIGSVGGYIPQQFKRYILDWNGSHVVVTLYAIGLHVTEGDISQIAQLNPADVSLFDTIMASLQFP